MKFYFCIVTTMLLLTTHFAIAQKEKKMITGSFEDMRVEQFLLELQRQTHYHFYYDTAQLDTIKINISVKNEPLEKVLEKGLASTENTFSIDNNNNVFVTRGMLVKTALPEGYFDAGNPNKTRSSGLLEEYQETETKQKAILENKLYEVGDKNAAPQSAGINVAGYIRDAKTGEPVAGASVFIDKPRIGTSTDQYGYYSIVLPRGRHVLNIQSIGMRDSRRQIMVYSDGKMNIDLQSQVLALKNVIVSSAKASNVKSTQMGVQRIDIKAIKQVPVAFGEADLLRVVLTLPGVKSVGEASTGLNVRGGSADQNLILFNDATIYNPSHFFGMFSAFNPEVVKDVELFKGSIPPKYGGRLSSVLDIKSREGNKKDFTGSAGIGLLTSRVNIEGPLIKDKASFILGGRTTYANWLLKALPDQYKNSKANFYDLNLNANYEMNKKNTLFVTGYFSKDRFNLNNDTTYGYSNQNVSVKWKHIFNNKMNATVVTGYDGYKYNISSDANPVNAYDLKFDINQLYLRAGFNYYLNSKHTLDFGGSTLHYKLHPGNLQPLGDKAITVPDVVPAEQAFESALYVNDKYNVTQNLTIEGGVRYSMFNNMGPQTINNYAPGLPKTEDNIVDTSVYSKGQVTKTYHGPEFRVSARYSITDNLSIKAGYNTQRQYIHMLSNTTAMAPTDIWKLSDPNIKPQFGDQISFGIYKNFKSNTIETSVEVYYKHIKDYLDYKSGAQLVLNHHIETDVINTKGKAYGVEFLIRKTQGKLNGWLSYTYSRTLLKMDDPTVGEPVNKGAFYPSNYDKPHDVTLVGNYRFSHRFSTSLNATYSTGRPITLPTGIFYYGGSARTLYSDRNAYRIPDYFRMDFAMNIEGNHKVHQKTHNSWTIGVYNLTGRKNPYSVYYTSENGKVQGYKLSIFGSAIPYVNFNIRF
ncbi:TonB-dependent receptor [Pinibacter aurantiacus]|uniref:TonB-dependent receptor n=1 Tax=Pinibacter aurantiacus TaxID=2851599 RepID=A0A9E2S5F2_9BACT|nr:TonB-dependent receptor [Pinibacter aurantiacus]MBV4356978.1 TonB-dependent receptor [Pinibacter aurantiacus]